MNDNGDQISVFYPNNAAPFIPQSCYANGARKKAELCRGINTASKSAFDALMLTGKGDEYAAVCVVDLVDSLVGDMGYEHILIKHIE
jgi:hypothetical protein